VKTYVALLRAVNLPGYQAVGMVALRDMLSDLGFVEPRSLLQSGNLVFRGDARKTSDIERLLEVGAGERLGLHTDFLVRTAAEWDSVVARNPLRAEATRDPGHLVVMFLKDAAAAKDVDALRAAISGPEIVRGDGKQAYMFYPAGIGRSRVTNKLVEAKLGTRGTGRNWNTVMRLAGVAETLG
jgi:uncharacterized protein (DUF1697 family)